jgi:hypothetical protein
VGLSGTYKEHDGRARYEKGRIPAAFWIIAVLCGSKPGGDEGAAGKGYKYLKFNIKMETLVGDAPKDTL